MRNLSHNYEGGIPAIFIIYLFVKNIAQHRKEIRETIRKFAAMACGQVRSENVVTKTGDHYDKNSVIADLGICPVWLLQAIDIRCLLVDYSI